MNCSANWRSRSTAGMPSDDENVSDLANSTLSAASQATNALPADVPSSAFSLVSYSP